MRHGILVLALVGCGILAGCGGSSVGQSSNESLYFVNNLSNVQRQDFVTGSLQNLFAGAGTVSEVRVSPDESKVVYRLGTQLRVSNIDGSGTVMLSEYKSADWNTDGTRLFAISTDNKIRSMNPDGTGVSADIYDANAGAGASQIAVNNTGTKIAFVSAPANGGQIYTIDVDGTNSLALTGPNTDYRWPSWSPDGSRLVFDDEDDVYTIDQDGTGLLQVANSPSAIESQASYHPDGTIVFISDGDIWTMSADGTNKTEKYDDVNPLSWPLVR